MAELRDIRKALAASLEGTVEGQISAYMLASPTPPCAYVFPDETEYHQAFDNGAENWGLVVRVLVSDVFDQGSQETLDQYLASDGPLSVKAALEADDELGGIVSSLMVERTTGYRQYQVGTGMALGADWIVNVLV